MTSGSGPSALRMIERLLLGELAGLHELVDERVILRETTQLPVAEQVGTAVTDMRDRNAVEVEIGRGQRRAHPVELPLGARARVDLAIGRRCHLGEPALRGPLGG